MHPAVVVGILNCTPDSFFDGGRHLALDQQLSRARTMIAEGADWIDVGGESTRPGAAPVDADEECRRVLPVIRALAAEGAARICIDTRTPAVAARALAAGATVLNDITGLRDPEMRAVSGDAEITVVMHMRGVPQTMSTLTDYADVVHEVRDALVEAAAQARSRAVWIDPGIGFAKTAEQSLGLLAATDVLVATGLPVYIGASRKSFIGHTLGVPKAADRLGGSLAAAAAARSQGARAFRVHDVAETRQLLDLLDELERRRNGPHRPAQG
jgi:dihydropteroate synthase